MKNYKEYKERTNLNSINVKIPHNYSNQNDYKQQSSRYYENYDKAVGLASKAPDK